MFLCLNVFPPLNHSPWQKWNKSITKNEIWRGALGLVVKISAVGLIIFSAPAGIAFMKS